MNRPDDRTILDSGYSQSDYGCAVYFLELHYWNLVQHY